jgi:hypothetical protein
VCVRYLTDVLACSVVSDLVVPFVRFAVKCLKTGVFNDNLIATCEKALNRFSTVYQRHALTAKVHAQLNCLLCLDLIPQAGQEHRVSLSTR